MFTYTYLILFLIGLLVIWVPWLLAHKIRPYFGKKKLASWLDEHKHKNKVNQALKTIHATYMGSNPFRTSKLARMKRKLESDQYLYGEVNLLTLVKLIDLTNPKADEIFYDLGSGGGRAVLMASLCYDFKICCGIELLKPLYHLAQQKRQAMIQIIKKKKPNFNSTAQFINGDFLTVDFSDADIIFVNATAYGGYIWDSLVTRFKNLKIGSRIIVTTFKLNYPQFKCILESHEVMSWGYCSVRIYQRIED